MDINKTAASDASAEPVPNVVAAPKRSYDAPNATLPPSVPIPRVALYRPKAAPWLPGGARSATSGFSAPSVYLVGPGLMRGLDLEDDGDDDLVFLADGHVSLLPLRP